MRSERQPTRAGLAAVMLVALALVMAVLTRSPLLVVGAAPLLLALVAELATAAPGAVDVVGSLEALRLLEHDATAVRLVLRPRTTKAQDWRFRLQTRGSLAAVDALGVRHRLEAGSSELALPVVSTGWGIAGVDAVVMEWHGPLRLTTVRRRVALHLPPLRVLPRPEALRVLVGPRRTGGWSGLRTARTVGRGTEFADVRPFALGDRPRDVHWPTTARRGEPWVATRHPEQGADVVLALDLFAPEALPEVVRVAVVLAEAHLGARDRVGVIGLGGVLTWVTPGGGDRHRLALVDQVVASQFVPTWVTRSVDHLPPHALPTGALVIGISALGEAMTTLAVELRSRGHDLVVVDLEPGAPRIPTPVDEAVDRLVRLQRTARRRRLRRLGATVVGLPAGASVDTSMATAEAQRRLVTR